MIKTFILGLIIILIALLLMLRKEIKNGKYKHNKRRYKKIKIYKKR